jgi:hypothetical protein
MIDVTIPGDNPKAIEREERLFQAIVDIEEGRA